MLKFHVTYDTVTPESAEHGDIAEGGFVLPGGWHQNMENCWGDEAAKVKAECGMSLREAVTLINTAALEDNGDSFRECDGNTNYRTGEVETRTLHLPDNVTPASYERVRRLLGMRD